MRRLSRPDGDRAAHAVGTGQPVRVGVEQQEAEDGDDQRIAPCRRRTAARAVPPGRARRPGPETAGRHHAAGHREQETRKPPRPSGAPPDQGRRDDGHQHHQVRMHRFVCRAEHPRVRSQNTAMAAHGRAGASLAGAELAASALRQARPPSPRPGRATRRRGSAGVVSARTSAARPRAAGGNDRPVTVLQLQDVSGNGRSMYSGYSRSWSKIGWRHPIVVDRDQARDQVDEPDCPAPAGRGSPQPRNTPDAATATGHRFVAPASAVHPRGWCAACSCFRRSRATCV